MLLRPEVLDATPHPLLFDVSPNKQRIVQPAANLCLRAEIERTTSLGAPHLEIAPGIVRRVEINETTYGGLEDPLENIREELEGLGRRNVIVGSVLGIRSLTIGKISTRALVSWPMGYEQARGSAKALFVPEARPLPEHSVLDIAKLAIDEESTRPIFNAMVDEACIRDSAGTVHRLRRTPSPLRLDLGGNKHLGYAKGKIPLIGGYVKGLKPFDLSSVPEDALLLVYSDTFPWLPPEIACRAVCGGNVERTSDQNQLPIFQSLNRYSEQTIRYARHTVGY